MTQAIQADPLSDTNVVLVVFGMPGCPACAEYMPKFTKQVEGFQAFGHPFVFYQPGMQLQKKQIPVVIVDSTSTDPSVQTLANIHNVQGLPCTVILPRIGHPTKYEGALPNEEIYLVLTNTLHYNR